MMGQQYNLGEKPTVILYTYYIVAMQAHLNRQKSTLNKNKTQLSYVLFGVGFKYW